MQPAQGRFALRRQAVPAWAGTALLVCILLAAWQGTSYWEYSDGVYAYSARELLHGERLYRDFAAAQPPPVYYAGALALAIDDSLTGLRVAMAAVELVTSLLVFVAVARLTGRRRVAAAAGVAALVMPWALREHAQLLPETFAAPLLLAAALAASRRRGAALAGALGALATSFKLAFVLPALAIVLAGRRVGRALIAYAAALALLAALFLLLFGSSLVRNAVDAQRDVGLAELHAVGGLWAQGAWNLLPLLVPAMLAWRFRGELRDPALVRSLLGMALGSLLLLGTLFKHGSSLTVLVVVEPSLLCLAVAGTVVALEERRATWSRRRRLASAAVVVAGLVGLAQVASLLATPDDPRLFTRPAAASGPGRGLSSAAVDAQVAAIRRCPATSAYGGPPALAFAAARRIAGDQPDQFIVNAALHADFRARIARERTICP